MRIKYLKEIQNRYGGEQYYQDFDTIEYPRDYRFRPVRFVLSISPLSELPSPIRLYKNKALPNPTIVLGEPNLSMWMSYVFLMVNF